LISVTVYKYLKINLKKQGRIMNEVMDVNAIMNMEADHYEAGLYQFSVKQAEVIETKTGRAGVNMQLKIEDTEILKGDRVPRGEIMFKSLYFPMTSDKKSSADFMARLVQEFLLAVDVQSHPDYSAVSADGIATQKFWDLVTGSVVNATVTWKEKREKTTDDNGNVTYVGTGENEQDIVKFKKAQ
jgi:hypothetical protein